MENDMFGAPMDMSGGRSSSVLDEVPETANPLIQGYSFDQTPIMSGISMLAGMQGEVISNVHFDVRQMNPACIADPSSLLPTFGDLVYDEVPGTRFQTYSSTSNLNPNGWSSSNAAKLIHHGYDYQTSSLFFSKALTACSSLRKEQPLKLATFSQDNSLLIVYNSGVQYLACGKPIL